MERLLKSRYRIKNKIGEGPFSVTYRGSYLDKDDPLIIKIYKRSVLSSSIIKSVKKKVRALCSLNHPNVAKVIDGDYGWQGFYFVRSFVHGRTLAELMEDGKKIGVDRAVGIMTGICEALNAAHSKGIIHGALNPNNVFVDENDAVLLTDFIASILEDRLPMVNVYEALAMAVPGVVAHQSALKDGESLKIPQFDPTMA